MVDEVLRKLGLRERPRPDLSALTEIYRRWCESVPFDNTLKLIHLQTNNPGPLPGDDAEDFFESWLEHGTGGTCWAANGALHALLRELGFDAHRAIATMLVRPDLPPNHGSVAVDLEEGRHLVDAGILHREPLPVLDRATKIDHFAWGVTASPDARGRTVVHWHPFHTEEGLDCRIESVGATAADFRELHEATREWSPFNYSLCLRLIREDRLMGFWFGTYGERTAAGSRRYEILDPAERERILRSELGFPKKLIEKLPPDRDVPPPPGP